MNFLTPREAEWVVARIEKDRHDTVAAEFNLGAYLRNAADLKVWGFAAIFGLTTTITYAIAFFLPIILRQGMGFSVALSQILVAPPYVVAAVVMFAMAWAGDKYHIRSPFILINAVTALIGKLSPCFVPSSLWLSFLQASHSWGSHLTLESATSVSSSLSPQRMRMSLALSLGKRTTSVANGSEPYALPHWLVLVGLAVLLVVLCSDRKMYPGTVLAYTVP